MNSLIHHFTDRLTVQFLATAETIFACFAFFVDYKRLCVHCASLANIFNVAVTGSCAICVGAASAANGR